MSGSQTPRSAAISTPFWDGALTGGLSIVFMGGLLAGRWIFAIEVSFDDADWIALALLVNTPHFMASYRVLYDSAARMRAHPWSSIVMPALLVAVLLACALVEQPQPILQSLVLASSVYLAWHYAGQTWGMVATFSYLAGVRYGVWERRLLRAGPRSLLALHVLFALSGRLPPRAFVDPTVYVWLYGWSFRLVCVLVGSTLLAGAWAFVSARRRGEAVPIRAVLPWVSLYLWYPFWYFVPGGFLWVQIAHALQYLSFPLRIEVNRYARSAESIAGHAAAPGAPRLSLAARRRRALFTYLGLVGVGAVVLHGPPLAAHAFGEGFWSTPDVRVLLLALTHCVGIHHYFVDGSIWHIRNASVREELFRHTRAGS